MAVGSVVVCGRREEKDDRQGHCRFSVRAGRLAVVIVSTPTPLVRSLCRPSPSSPPLRLSSPHSHSPLSLLHHTATPVDNDDAPRNLATATTFGESANPRVARERETQITRSSPARPPLVLSRACRPHSGARAAKPSPSNRPEEHNLRPTARKNGSGERRIAPLENPNARFPFPFRRRRRSRLSRNKQPTHPQKQQATMAIDRKPTPAPLGTFHRLSQADTEEGRLVVVAGATGTVGQEVRPCSFSERLPSVVAKEAGGRDPRQ